ncbi:hypothetical protein F0L46_08570 [Salinarimonas soli]|uniref:Uncharacterized protein n=1 Tax=Salinarimonas soli TaxID=1638099 RepID=A0A5B2VE50_9HYPH|nr:hypothetical protein F0L46_08570 [Salinarimonas soli]
MAPICRTCNQAARLTTKAEIYPNRPDLAEKAIWICEGCGARVGCHPGTTTALGFPAGPELRAARGLLHDQLIDPLWRNAWREPCYAAAPRSAGEADRAKGKHRRVCINRAARSRVYAFLADRLGIPGAECHTGMFDLERCRAAWRALRGVTYREIRVWAQEREAAERERRAA